MEQTETQQNKLVESKRRWEARNEGAIPTQRKNACKLINDGAESFVAYKDYGLDQICKPRDRVTRLKCDISQVLGSSELFCSADSKEQPHKHTDVLCFKNMITGRESNTKVQIKDNELA